MNRLDNSVKTWLYIPQLIQVEKNINKNQRLLQLFLHAVVCLLKLTVGVLQLLGFVKDVAVGLFSCVQLLIGPG